MAVRLLATPSDLAAFAGLTVDPDDPRATAAVTHASAVVAAYLPDRALPADDPVPDVARTVTVLIAADLWTNPLHRDAWQTSPDGGSWQAGSSSAWLLTPERRDMLDALAARARPARPRIGTARLKTVWEPPRAPWTGGP